MEKEVKKRKQRRSYNCGPCKRQKIKCDTCIPCGACVRHNRIDQCLANPPNPPTDNERKKARLLKEGGGVAVSGPGAVNSNLDATAANASNLNSSITNNTNGPVNNATYAQQEIRLPSIKTYTSTFKITGEIQPQQTTLLPLASASAWDHNRAQTDLDKYSYSTNTLNNPSIINANNNPSEVLALRQEVKSLHERLAFLESKLTAANASNDQMLSSIESLKQPSSTPSVHTPYAQFIDCIRKLPSVRSLDKILLFYKGSLNNIMEIFDNKLVDSSLASLTAFIDSSAASNGSSTQVSIPTTITNSQWESLSVIAMITSLSILQYPPSIVESQLNIKLDSLITYSNTLFQISKTALNAVKYRENPKLIHLRILLLFDRYLHLFIKKSLMLALDSELVSMSYVMGLQTLAIPQNSLEIEQSQRVWWTICHYDALKALKFQMPPLIRLDTINNSSDNGSSSGVGSLSNSSSSHILKAFISAENTSYQSIITHIAKITKICNSIPTSIGHTMVEYIESMIISDRQLTSYNVPQFFNLMNPRSDIRISFQSCYLHFFITLSRFRIYQKIYFNNEKYNSDQLNFDGLIINQSIWFIMFSIIESFLKKYSELRTLYPLKDNNNAIQYIQISEFLITGVIIHLIMEISPNSNFHPQDYKTFMKEYSTVLLQDLKYLESISIFNESLPFYNQSFKTIEKLLNFQLKQEQTFNSPQYLESFEVKQKKLQLTNELQSSKILESEESTTGLIPSNDFFNQYLGSFVYLLRNNYNFHAHNSSSSSQLPNNVSNNNNNGSNMTSGTPIDNWGLSEILDNEQLEFLNYLGL